MSVHKWLFWSISASGSNFYLQDTIRIPPAKNFDFLEREQKVSFPDGHEWYEAYKISMTQRNSAYNKKLAGIFLDKPELVIDFPGWMLTGYQVVFYRRLENPAIDEISTASGCPGFLRGSELMQMALNFADRSSLATHQLGDRVRFYIPDGYQPFRLCD